MEYLNKDVSELLSNLNHPFNNEIQTIRRIILTAAPALKENIKWRGPNYTLNNIDIITLKVFPTNNIVIVFHGGAKKENLTQPRIAYTSSNLLVFKDNSRAIITLNNKQPLSQHKEEIITIIGLWVDAFTK